MPKTQKILVVDNDLDSLRLIVRILRECNNDFMIFQANNAQNALAIAENKMPNIIITDWNMPEKSGIDLIFDLKNNSKTKDIPVIIATGFMLSPDDLKTALQVGAVDYIRKPINPVELEARVNSALLLSQSYKEAILLKNKEINENMLYLVKGNQFIESLGKELSGFEIKTETDRIFINKLKIQIDQFLQSNIWERFDASFGIIYADFNQKLLAEYPNLTPKDLKVCAFIMLGMSTKDIASVLSQTPDSIKVARYRIRKKLNLGDKENLQTFLATCVSLS